VVPIARGDRAAFPAAFDARIFSDSGIIRIRPISFEIHGGSVADIVLINPRFEISFWGLGEAMPFLRKRATIPTSALPLLAALTPSADRVTIIDENVEPIDFERCQRADIVGVTGMVVQRHRMREILVELKKRGCYVVVGGPWITVNEGYFGDLVDVAFIGEAEETWPRFMADWQSGNAARRYEQSERTDMTRVPAPRLDLLKMQHYAFGSVQFTRGCPFQCEFCDIIVVFGRRPRFKTPQQIIAELEDLVAYKIPLVFIVDDNLIGNKKAIKEVLKHVIAWQEGRGYPLSFMTEASIDLADDPELMRLMAQANIGSVFVGIESTNEDALRETRKLQNIRPGGTLVEKVRRIQAAGMDVFGGLIAGFDNDDERVFANHRRFAQDARLSIAMVGMLSAIPKTPLYDRLAAEGRLDLSDAPAYGTNVLPSQMSREALSRGFVRLMAELYEPDAFFNRLDELYLTGRAELDRGWQDYAARYPWRGRRRHFRMLLEAFGLMGSLSLGVQDRKLWSVYRHRFWRFFRARPSPVMLRAYALRCAIHYHMHRLVRVLQGAEGPLVNTY
jgi:radical SAM superfamily enzyme YgiQ (UPF0313 family)